ncbi:MAG: hypothetical protein JNJ49_06375 [Bdellovibrionaceae bacterium]|nr:hypothetical protein [Pseudobdellovibrionaceae bacterium]
MKQHGAISRRTLNEDYFNGLRYLASVLITSALLLIGTVGGFFLLPFLMTAVVMAFLPFFALVVVSRIVLAAFVQNIAAEQKIVDSEQNVLISNNVIRMASRTGFEVTGDRPVVMIVEDDVDSAQAVESIFKSFGCETIIATKFENAHRRMAFQKIDLIVLDWLLGEQVKGGQIVEKAAKLIENVKDLKGRFAEHHPKIITFSSLEEKKVQWPENHYFDHYGHWQKPINYNQLREKTLDFLNANVH